MPPLGLPHISCIHEPYSDQLLELSRRLLFSKEIIKKYDYKHELEKRITHNKELLGDMQT
jgi:hypothetical protein